MLAGWLASIVMRTDARQGALPNIAVGILGALIGGWLFSSLTGQAIQRAVSDQGRPVRLPATTRALLIRLRRAHAELTQRLGHEPAPPGSHTCR